MEILRWQAGNELKNYQYIICDDERNAVLIDPLDSTEIQRLIAQQKLSVKAILISHEHDDHAALAGPLQKVFSTKVISSQQNVGRIAAQLTTVANGEVLSFGGLNVRAIETPGHTAGHIAFEIGGFLFTADCLFHGGCGHCRSAGANIEEHYRTLHERLARLRPDLVLMPGHYYARRNLDFSLHVEPDNGRARALRARLTTDSDEMAHQTTLKQEREYNPFLRLSRRNLRARISELTGRNLSEASDFAVFRELRALRDTY